MTDYDFCPLCGGITEAGGDSTCTCHLDEDAYDDSRWGEGEWRIEE